MAEPTSSAAGGVALWKLAGVSAAGGMTLGTLVVMLMTKPRTEREWAVALISCAVSSLAGGAYLILRYGLHEGLPHNALGLFLALAALGGVFFVCALPGWLLVRVAFNTFNRWQDKTAPEIADEVKKVIP